MKKLNVLRTGIIRFVISGIDRECFFVCGCFGMAQSTGESNRIFGADDARIRISMSRSSRIRMEIGRNSMIPNQTVSGRFCNAAE